MVLVISWSDSYCFTVTVLCCFFSNFFLWVCTPSGSKLHNKNVITTARNRRWTRPTVAMHRRLVAFFFSPYDSSKACVVGTSMSSKLQHPSVWRQESDLAVCTNEFQPQSQRSQNISPNLPGQPLALRFAFAIKSCKRRCLFFVPFPLPTFVSLRVASEQGCLYGILVRGAHALNVHARQRSHLLVRLGLGE